MRVRGRFMRSNFAYVAIETLPRSATTGVELERSPGSPVREHFGQPLLKVSPSRREGTCIACLRLPRSRAGVAPGFQLPHPTGGEGPGDGSVGCPFCSTDSAPPRHETGGASNRKNTKHVLRQGSIRSRSQACLDPNPPSYIRN